MAIERPLLFVNERSDTSSLLPTSLYYTTPAILRKNIVPPLWITQPLSITGDLIDGHQNRRKNTTHANTKEDNHDRFNK